MFCRISAFCHIRHLRFSVLTPVHRVRDPLVFCDNFRQVLDVLDSFCRFCQCLSLFNTFRHFCHLRFSVFTSMHRVRDPLVFCDDSREVRDLLTFFTRFCRFWFFCVHFCDEFSLDFDISWCPARLRLTLHGVQITLV